MPALMEKKSCTSADHIHKLESKLHQARRALANLPGEDFYSHLNTIIRRPGWTTVAEALFFDAALDNILGQTEILAYAHHKLMAASNAVEM
jgi:hypothetical protein